MPNFLPMPLWSLVNGLGIDTTVFVGVVPQPYQPDPVLLELTDYDGASLADASLGPLLDRIA